MVGIITFVNEDNYGAVLQAYAMQTYLYNQGIENEFLNIRLQDYSIQNTSLLKCICVKLILYRKKRNFRKFRKNMKISSDRMCNLEKYSKLIIGSDQVWNPLLTGKELQPVFFGEGFIGDVVGYACSCGNTTVLEDKKEILKKYLKNFNHISVREHNLENFLQSLTQKDVCTVLDPVFLLKDEEWRNFVCNLQYKRKRDSYIFVYLLENSLTDYKCYQ